MADTCNVEAFRYQSTPQLGEEGGVSGNEINEKYLEDYLERLRQTICNDLNAITVRLDAIEARLTALEGSLP